MYYDNYKTEKTEHKIRKKSSNFTH